MFENYELKLVPLHRYLSAPKAQQRSMLPSAPGIYVWTRDLSQLLPHSGTPEDLHDLLSTRVRPPPVADRGLVGKYRKIELFDAPPGFRPNTLARLQRLGAAGYPLELEWALLCGGLFQRPLYVGKALNLRTRTRQHLSGRGNSRGVPDILANGLALQDCLLILAVLATPPAEGEDDDSELEEDSELLDELEAEDDIAPWVTLARDVVDDLISVAESTVIRMAHPVFNDQMS